jgi:hypothetical protein
MVINLVCVCVCVYVVCCLSAVFKFWRQATVFEMYSGKLPCCCSQLRHAQYLVSCDLIFFLPDIE